MTALKTDPKWINDVCMVMGRKGTLPILRSVESGHHSWKAVCDHTGLNVKMAGSWMRQMVWKGLLYHDEKGYHLTPLGAEWLIFVNKIERDHVIAIRGADSVQP